MSVATPPAAAAAGKAGDDDVKEGDNAVDDAGKDGADGIDDGHQAVADRAEDGFELCTDVSGLVSRKVDEMGAFFGMLRKLTQETTAPILAVVGLCGLALREA